MADHMIKTNCKVH